MTEFFMPVPYSQELVTVLEKSGNCISNVRDFYHKDRGWAREMMERGRGSGISPS